MLTLQVMSDLHLELHADGGYSFTKSLDPTGVDVLVLAGDIVSSRFPTQARIQLQRFAEKYPKVIYVPGNHELWYSSAEEALTSLRSAAKGLPNFTFLDNQAVTIKGHRLIGGPMWFPRWSPAADFARLQMPDFENIPGFDPWVVGANTKFRAFMEKELRVGDVVVTHYLPSMKSVSPRYKGSMTNAFFVSEMDSLIIDRRPTLWLHGHTHDSVDYRLDGTRIVCNPFGYPNMLNPGYIEKLLIVVE